MIIQLNYETSYDLPVIALTMSKLQVEVFPDVPDRCCASSASALNKVSTHVTCSLQLADNLRVWVWFLAAWVQRVPFGAKSIFAKL